MMTFKEWLLRWKMENLNINTVFFSAQMKLNNSDRNVPWEIFILNY
jgi:hypothetical protein